MNKRTLQAHACCCFIENGISCPSLFRVLYKRRWGLATWGGGLPNSVSRALPGVPSRPLNQVYIEPVVAIVSRHSLGRGTPRGQGRQP